MHLSLLSDTGSSRDTSTGYDEPTLVRSLGRPHLDGLIRGLAFLAAIALPLSLAIATGHAGQHVTASVDETPGHRGSSFLVR